MNKAEYEKLLEQYFSGDTNAASILGVHILKKDFTALEIQYTLNLINQKITDATASGLAWVFNLAQRIGKPDAAGLAWNLHGYMLEHGRINKNGIPDYQKAIASYDRAIRLRNIYALHNRVNMLMLGEGTEDGQPDYPHAIALLEPAIEWKNAYAMHLRAGMYAKGQGTKDGQPNYPKAIELLEQAVKLKHIPAMIDLASIFRKGIRTQDKKPNYSKAIALLEQVVALKNTTGMIPLAEMLLKGQGTKDNQPNYKAAIFYLHRALVLSEGSVKTCYQLLANIHASDLFQQQNDLMTPERNSALTTISHSISSFPTTPESFLNHIQWERRIAVIEHKMVYTTIVENGEPALQAIRILHQKLLRAESTFLSAPVNNFERNCRIFKAECEKEMFNATWVFLAHPNLRRFVEEISDIINFSKPPSLITICRSTLFASTDATSKPLKETTSEATNRVQ